MSYLYRELNLHAETRYSGSPGEVNVSLCCQRLLSAYHCSLLGQHTNTHTRAHTQTQHSTAYAAPTTSPHINSFATVLQLRLNELLQTSLMWAGPLIEFLPHYNNLFG